MNRYAWLEFNEGTWHLLTDNPGNPSRRWADKTAALSELAKEGWNISGPFPKCYGLDPTYKPSLGGFILIRCVQ